MEVTKLAKRVQSVEVVSLTPWDIDGNSGITVRGEFMGGTIKFPHPKEGEPLQLGDVVALDLDAKFDQAGNVTLKATVIQPSDVKTHHVGE